MFTIYSKPGCGLCDKAKTLLEKRKIAYEELVLDVGQVKQPGITYFTVEQLKRLLPSARTVPLIFDADGQLVGGYSALAQRLQ